MGYMIGVDVGGTFTDFSVFNQETGELFNYKDSSTPADPSRDREGRTGRTGNQTGWA